MARTFNSELAEIRRGIEELGRREMHPLKVYRPTPWQLPIHESRSEELLVSGGKRSGKTLASVMEVASRILGIPITRPDGSLIQPRFRRATHNNPQLYWVVGLNIDHIGQTIYHRLFSPGLGCNFRLIQDLTTNQWRAFNESDPQDVERYDQSVISPPLIGDDRIIPDSWHMESAAGNVFKSVRLTNGATICAYPSTGDRPKMGDAVHGIWIDEDIANPSFIKEWQDRLITTNGWMIWSVWPQMTNFALIEAMDRAEACKDDPDPPIQCFSLEGSKNPYNSPRGVARGLARMDDDDDMAHRDRGDIRGLMGNYAMYDFATAVHIARAKEHSAPSNSKELIESLLARYARLPDDWTRYIAVDPSNTRTACIFGVVPPPEYERVDLGNLLIIEDELVVRRHTPRMLADALVRKAGHLRFEAFIMDSQMGRQTTVGNDGNVYEAYGQEFSRVGLVSRVTKSGFLRGCPQKAQRRLSVRLLLEPTYNGLPRLLLVESKTVETQREFQRYRKKHTLVNGQLVVLDEAMNERAMDCMQATEYLCQLIYERFQEGTAYMPPEFHVAAGGSVYQAAMSLRSTLDAREGAYVHFGPGAHV